MSTLITNNVLDLDGNVLLAKGQAAKYVNSLQDLLAANMESHKVVNVLNYHTGLEGGGGVFYWDASKPKAEHNGGTVIDPAKVFPSDWNNQTQLTAWFTAGNSGTGCWVRQYDGIVDFQFFGLKGTEPKEISDKLVSGFLNTGVQARIPMEAGTFYYDKDVVKDVKDDRLLDNKNLSLINTISRDISYLRHKLQSKIVVIGDSISYNRYSYDPTSRVSAETAKNGYKSWSYMIRDAFTRNLPGWRPATSFMQDVVVSTAPVTESVSPYFDSYFIPLGGEGQYAVFNNVGEVFSTYVPPIANSKWTEDGVTQTDLYLYYMTKNDEGGTFNVDIYNQSTNTKIGGTVEISTLDGNYLGIELKVVKISTTDVPSVPLRIDFTCASKVNTLSKLLLMGAANSSFEWVNKGVGGQTAEWMETQKAVVTAENPDLVFILIGANDLAQNRTEDAFYNDVYATVSYIKQNSSAEVILLGTPPSSSFPASRGQIASRVQRRIANELNCGSLDLYNVFRNIPVSIWRADNVHFNRVGNQILFEALHKNFFPSLNVDYINQYDTQKNDSVIGYSNADKNIRFNYWNPLLKKRFEITYSTIDITFTLNANWGNAGTISTGNNIRHRFYPISDNNFEVVYDGSHITLHVKQPFYFESYSPRIVPEITFNRGTFTGGAVYELKLKDAGGTPSGDYYYILKDGVHVTSSSHITENISFLFTFAW